MRKPRRPERRVELRGFVDSLEVASLPLSVHIRLIRACALKRYGAQARESVFYSAVLRTGEPSVTGQLWVG